MPKDYICNVRLIDVNSQVLGWTRLPAETRGDGCLWAKHHFVFEADRDGIGTEMAIHEPDLNVWTFVPLPQPLEVTAGKVFTIRLEKPLLQFGSSARPLPGVTVRTNVVVGIAAATR